MPPPAQIPNVKARLQADEAQPLIRNGPPQVGYEAQREILESPAAIMALEVRFKGGTDGK